MEAPAYSGSRFCSLLRFKRKWSSIDIVEYPTRTNLETNDNEDAEHSDTVVLDPRRYVIS